MTEPTQRPGPAHVGHGGGRQLTGASDEADATRDAHRRLPERIDLTRVVTTQASVPAGLLWLATGAVVGGGDADDGD